MDGHVASLRLFRVLANYTSGRIRPLSGPIIGLNQRWNLKNILNIWNDFWRIHLLLLRQCFLKCNILKYSFRVKTHNRVFN